MRRSHIYERTAPRLPREPYAELASTQAVARSIAERLRPLVANADRVGEAALVRLLEVAQREAERLADGPV